MERTVKPHFITFLSPAAPGWRVAKGQEVTHVSTLQEAAAAIPEGSAVHVALPSRLVFFERMRLPSVETNELSDMARLQLEKTIPFPLEEVASDLEVLGKEETESDVLTMAAHQPPVTDLCKPLLELGRWPERVTVFVRHAAAACPQDAHVLLIYQEDEQIVAAIARSGKLLQVQSLDTEDLEHELSAFLLSSELEGISVQFDRVCLDEKCADLKSRIVGLVPALFVTISLDRVPVEVPGDLAPPSWREERKRAERGARLKSYLIAAGGIWVALLVLGALWLGWLQFRTNRLASQVVRLQPDVEFVQSRQSRWLELAPALDRSLYTVEILRLVQESNPSPDLRFTQFEQSPSQFMVEGEAPSAGVAVELLQRLRDNPGLQQFTFDDMTPSLLPNDHAQFRIFGKR